MENNRNYGLDFLKVLLMYLVVVLHVMYPGGVVDINDVNSSHYNIYIFFYIIIHCVDNCFALVSGYTAKNKQFDGKRIINMWLQVFFYSFLIFALSYLFGIVDNINVINLIKSALPVTFNKYWYFTAYFGLYLLKPFINKVLFNLDNKELKTLFVINIVLFSFVGTFGANSFNTQYGYSFLWITILYITGVIVNRLELFKNIKSYSAIFILILCILITWFTKVYFDVNFIFSLTSFVSVFYSILIVLLFSRIKFNKGISVLCKYSFGVYLFEGSILGQYLKSLITVNNEKIIICMASVLLYSFALFAIGIIIDLIRSKIFNFTKTDCFVEYVNKKIIKAIDLY